jgi:hypothetical protein
MLPFVPGEIIVASWEVIGCLLTSVLAIVSYVLIGIR